MPSPLSPCNSKSVLSLNDDSKHLYGGTLRLERTIKLEKKNKNETR